jgi:ferritin-like metal-binding protein YciE
MAGLIKPFDSESNNLLLGRLTMAANSFQELYVEQLQDLYSAEQQIIKALPKMIEAAQSEELRDALTEHLEVTRTQAGRIETICQELGEDPGNEKCKGMEGVLKEGSDLVKEVPDEVRDAAIIAAAQRVEHYEMAGYGTARTYAQLLGFDEAANVLEQTLDEEKEADQTLSGLAEELNVEALEEGENEAEGADSQESEEKSATTLRAKKAGRGRRAA